MPPVWGKLDSGLALIYDNFLHVRQRGATNVRPHPIVAADLRLHVMLQYEGNLALVEQAGFITTHDDGQGSASGSISLHDVERLTSLKQVVKIRAGSEHDLDLDVSIPQIRANQVWSQGGAPLFEFAGATGEGVIVGIIDTGVDFRHPFLWRRSTPDKATRILRIWDQGLTAVAPETPPDVALLSVGGPGTYGVEYTDAHINKILQGVAGAMPVRHRDCSAHGTHVSSTAAGDGRFKFKFRGVAPRADLVVVKILHLETLPVVGMTAVTWERRFRDAVTYVRKVADSFAPKRPVVINYSAGTMMGPHDGLDVEEDWLSHEFRDANSAGKIFVTSAGNAANKRHHTRIEFAAAGAKEIPLELFDNRGGATTESDSCSPEDNTKWMRVEIYYPVGATTVGVAIKPQGAAAFTAGPALGAADVTGTFSTRSFRIVHEEDKDTLIGGAIIRRNVIRINVIPHAVAMHLVGDYVVKLTASAAATLHAWCFQYGKQGLKFKDPLPAPLAGSVFVEDKNLVGSPAGATNVITVAAYNAEVAGLDVAAFSSRGPLARHGVGGAAPDKPDIGAPGVKIDAAKSQDIMPAKLGITIPMQGTSMASPHVTGVVALMLQKNKTLTPSQARKFLKDNANKLPPPVKDEIGAGRLDAKGAVDGTP